MNKKFYIFEQSAEDESYGIVELTNDEVIAVKKFLDAPIVIAGDWVGGMRIFDDRFDTYDEAYEFLMEHRYEL